MKCENMPEMTYRHIFMWSVIIIYDESNRLTKLEAEELGLETDGMVESTSKLRDIIKSTTKFDILEADGKTYKNMYEIILGIGKEWEHLNDTTRAGLLETLAGKKQSNTLAAVLNNIERLEDVYNTAENSAGSAQTEQNKYAKSLKYSLDQLKAQGEEFWTTFINKDDVKWFLNILNDIIEKATKLVDTFGSIPSIVGVLGGFAAIKNFGGNKMYFLLF